MTFINYYYSSDGGYVVGEEKIEGDLERLSNMFSILNYEDVLEVINKYKVFEDIGDYE